MKMIFQYSILTIVLQLSVVSKLSSQVEVSNRVDIDMIDTEMKESRNYFSLSGGINFYPFVMALYGTIDYNFANNYYVSLRGDARGGGEIWGRRNSETISASLPLGFLKKIKCLNIKVGAGPSLTYLYRYTDEVIGSTLGGLVPVYASKEDYIFGLTTDASLLLHVSKPVSIGFFYLYNMNTIDDYYLFGLKLNIDLNLSF